MQQRQHHDVLKWTNINIEVMYFLLCPFLRDICSTSKEIIFTFLLTLFKLIPNYKGLILLESGQMYLRKDCKYFCNTLITCCGLANIILRRRVFSLLNLLRRLYNEIFILSLWVYCWNWFQIINAYVFYSQSWY